MMKETCRNCKYYETDGKQEDVGACYRFPPVPLAYGQELATVRPMVTDKDSCGEFKVDIKVMH